MQESFLIRLFNELEYLNTVPKFQLERAISPLLGIFIKEIINSKYKTNVILSIPEFPLKKHNNQSTNIDWLLFDNSSKTLYFVELKTDKFSFREKQNSAYRYVRDKFLKAKNASFLFNELSVIKDNSIRKVKYQTIFNKLNKKGIDRSAYLKFEFIYLGPSGNHIQDNNTYDKILLFTDLPLRIKTIYKKEWHQLRKFLKNLNPSTKKKVRSRNVEGNIAVFKDLGIYSDDPEEDEKINQDLIKFLESQGYKMPKVKIKGEDE